MEITMIHTTYNALVTGASQGLGRALAFELAQRGAHLALVARDLQDLDAVAADLRRSGATAHAIAGDLGDKEAIHRIAGAAAGALGDIDLVIHNASTLGALPMRELLDAECEDFERVLQVNLLGPFRLTKVLAGSMALRGRGTVVFVSSDAAVRAYAGWGPYGVSKAAADHMARIWAEELRPHGVRVLAVDPGEMDTRMHADALPDADRSVLARPEHVARTIVDAIADTERFATGTRFEAAHVVRAS
jgi:NAD(P)-dependent dehydrogenase (short-subunit alcohol dehydrogenase family)